MKIRCVRDALEKVGISVSVAWHGASTKLSYRNRGNFVPAREAGGRVVLGSFAPRSHEVVSMTGCVAVRPCIARTRDRNRAACFIGRLTLNSGFF